MIKKVCVIDYGMGNIESVAKSFEKAGAVVSVSSNLKKIASSDAVVLPGVGAFDAAVRNLKKKGLWQSLPEIIAIKPFFGICLGLQLLFEKSEEGNCKGFGILDGKVGKFDFSQLSPLNSQIMKIPHMGWNSVEIKKQRFQSQRVKSNLRNTSTLSGVAMKQIPTLNKRSFKSVSIESENIFKGIPNGSYFYFVHSYYVAPVDKNIIATTTNYGIDFCSSIFTKNIFACQFHPEKSGEVGLKLIKNFLTFNH